MELAEQPAAAGTASGAAAAAGDLAASVFEVVEQQPPLHQELAQQEPFVLVSVDDAIEGMAYYIALYLSRAPEARYMEPKQLQAALKQTFTVRQHTRTGCARLRLVTAHPPPPPGAVCADRPEATLSSPMALSAERQPA